MNLNKRTLLIVPALVVSLSALTGCSALSALTGGNSAPVRDAESGDIVEENTNADVFSLRVGDCLDTDESMGDETMSVPVVPCSEPHADEIYYSFDITESTYPGNDEVIRIADEGWYAEFEGFVGERQGILHTPALGPEGDIVTDRQMGEEGIGLKDGVDRTFIRP